MPEKDPITRSGEMVSRSREKGKVFSRDLAVLSISRFNLLRELFLVPV